MPPSLTLVTPKRQTAFTPLQATQRLLDISVTEAIQFKECRRRWFLETVDNLEPVGVSQVALSFGTGIHAALEAYYHSGGLEDALWAGWNEWRAEVKELTDAGEDWDALLDLIELGEVMLNNYQIYEDQTRLKIGEVLQVEGLTAPGAAPLPHCGPEGYPESARVTRHESGRFQCPIVDPLTREPLERDGHVPQLTARLDLITERSTPRKGLWIVDHKTAAGPPNDKGLDFDSQVTGYSYVLWRRTGIIPRGVLYNVLIKSVPEMPRILKNGDISTAKDQNTTPDLYRTALQERGLMRGGKVTSVKHSDCLEALLVRGWDSFYRRFEPTRNLDELVSFERRLVAEYRDMSTAKDETSYVYPNPSPRRCPYCPVNPLCQAIEDGSDADGVLTSRFRQKPDRKAARVVTP